MEFDLDDWLPDPQVRSRHRRVARAPADSLWHSAESVRLCDTPTLGRIVRWRIPRTSGHDAFRDLFRTYPFTVLDEGEQWSISGLAGRIWTLARDYPQLDSPHDFLAWDEPGTVRVLFAHWTVALPDGGSELVSEARVQPVDRRAGLRLRALWGVVGRFERLIGGEALTAAVKRAE